VYAAARIVQYQLRTVFVQRLYIPTARDSNMSAPLAQLDTHMAAVMPHVPPVRCFSLCLEFKSLLFLAFLLQL
jgi:hypothetical protein